MTSRSVSQPTLLWSYEMCISLLHLEHTQWAFELLLLLEFDFVTEPRILCLMKLVLSHQFVQDLDDTHHCTSCFCSLSINSMDCRGLLISKQVKGTSTSHYDPSHAKRMQLASVTGLTWKQRAVLSQELLIEVKAWRRIFQYRASTKLSKKSKIIT